MRKLLSVALVSLSLMLFYSNITVAYEKEIKSISSTVSGSISKAGKKTIAVVDFTDLQGNVTELGRFLAEELSVDLPVTASGFSVIDRTHLKSILTEHQLSITGLVDPKTVKKLGQIAGVDAIVTGSVTPFGDSIRVTAKVIATDTAMVLVASKGDIAKTKAIEELLSKSVETAKLSSNSSPSTPPTLTSAPVNASKRVDAHGFIFELQGCKAIDKIVTCSLIITSSNDKVLELYARHDRTTVIYDDSSKEYSATNVQLLDSTSNRNLKRRLMPDIPVKVFFTFENIPLQVKGIPLFEIEGWDTARNNYMTVRFRNIALIR